MTEPRILIIGMSAGGADSLPSNLIERILAADILAGGRRQLGYFPAFRGETLPITAEVESVAARLQQVVDAGQWAVVLASGDPLCYGIAASLRRYFPAEALEVVPAPTAFQMAFAALAEPWADALFLSAHARPLPDVVRRVLTAPKAAILTDSTHHPAAIAEALLAAGLSPASPCAVCENLGSAEERVVRSMLAETVGHEFAKLNVFVVWPQFEPRPPAAPGLPDEAFSTTGGLITKREIRLLSLAELGLMPGDALWDIGAGSGSLSLEAALAQPLARVYAIEKRAELAAHLRENLRRFPAPNVTFTEGLAPADIGDWPDPDAVFIGGSGGFLAELIALAQQRLRPGGRLVINLATLENLDTVRRALPDARLVQAQINRAAPILDMVRFEALNPIFIVTWRKE